MLRFNQIGPLLTDLSKKVDGLSEQVKAIQLQDLSSKVQDLSDQVKAIQKLIERSPCSYRK